ncbi:MAG: hypothetical protein ABIF88_03900 [archaeon]
MVNKEEREEFAEQVYTFFTKRLTDPNGNPIITRVVSAGSNKKPTLRITFYRALGHNFHDRRQEELMRTYEAMDSELRCWGYELQPERTSKQGEQTFYTYQERE